MKSLYNFAIWAAWLALSMWVILWVAGELVKAYER